MALAYIHDPIFQKPNERIIKSSKHALQKEVSKITGCTTETFQHVTAQLAHTNVTSQTIIDITLTQTIIKNPKIGPRILNPNARFANGLKGIIFVGLALGLGIIDCVLNLNQSVVSVAFPVILAASFFKKFR